MPAVAPDRSPRTDRRRPGPLAALGAACALALTLAACGSSGGDTGAAATTTAPPASGPAANAVTITTPGMQFQTSGSLHPGVATITLKNTDQQSHMLALGRMKPGVTLDQVKAALGQDEEAAAALLADPPDGAVYGTPAPVGPGESSTVTAADLPAGQYVLLCFFTDDAGMPHWQMGMVGSLEVSGDPVTAKPASDGTIAIDDEAITLPAGFDGHGTFLVQNKGTAEHSISFARLDAGTTFEGYFQHVGEAMGSGKSIDGGGGTLVGGVDDLLPGESAYLTLDLKTAHYAYVSTADAQGPGVPPQHGELDVP
jgi:hypothetical protein